tara:strand:- start:503 stop:655 length:153 start_codon:yes stop_codon:yes gene_type:complete
MERAINVVLALFFIAWAFRMAYRFNAQYDAVFMLLISLAIFQYGRKQGHF